jgi:inner membrane protein
MTGKTHQTAGITAGLGYFMLQAAPTYQPATLAAVLVGSSLAALLPDIDQPASVIWDKIPFVGHAAGKVTEKATFGHRNLTHSLLGFVIIGLLLYWLLSKFPSYWGINTNVVLISMMISYAVHLLADSFTVHGIPLLWPWQRNFGIPPKPLDGIRIETGQWFENLIIFPLLNIILIVLVIFNWQNIKTFLFK